MPKRFITQDARTLNSMFAGVRDGLKEKIINSDNETRRILDGALLEYIQDLDLLFQHPSVRGNRDPNVRNPMVDMRSVTGKLLKRMKRQIEAICTLADVVSIGPAANAHEAEVVSRAHEVLNLLYDAITPPFSSSSSDAQTETE